MGKRPALSVVVPSYRQALTICGELERLDAFLTGLVPSHEIILVIDGNDDQTFEVVREQLRLPHVQVEYFMQNQGKGLAVRHGMLAARGDLVAFMDAGGDVTTTDLDMLWRVFQFYQADVAIGSKRHSLSEIDYPRLRRVYSRTYQILNRILFRLRVSDTQVGLKLFRRAVVQAIMPRVLVKQFAFDLELLVVAYRLGYTRIVESPVKMRYGFTSSVSWRSVVQTLWDTLAVFYRLRFLKWYDHVHPLPTETTTVSVNLRADRPAFQPLPERESIKTPLG